MLEYIGSKSSGVEVIRYRKIIYRILKSPTYENTIDLPPLYVPNKLQQNFQLRITICVGISKCYNEFGTVPRDLEKAYEAAVKGMDKLETSR